MTDRQPCVYILASGRHGTLYIGVTSNLMTRLYQHREGLIAGFTKQYGVYRLVHFELCETMPDAIAREKQLKAWRRDWKIALIEQDNPFWEDRAWGSVSRQWQPSAEWILTFVRMTRYCMTK